MDLTTIYHVYMGTRGPQVRKLPAKRVAMVLDLDEAKKLAGELDIPPSEFWFITAHTVVASQERES